MSNWKQQHANESDKAWGHPIVEDVIVEQMGNIARCGPFKEDDAMLRMGLSKIAMYAAQVARAQALGFDPELLRMSAGEADTAILELAERAVRTGKPVVFITAPSQNMGKATG